MRCKRIGILYEEEEFSPSNEEAIDKFKLAAIQWDMQPVVFTTKNIHALYKCDALFIRSTTGLVSRPAIFADAAAELKMPCIDDDRSIRVCCNKRRQLEIAEAIELPIPKTKVVTLANWRNMMCDITYPCILKKVDSSFSRGVFKIGSSSEFMRLCTQLIHKEVYMLVQEFIQTEFDWRVTVLDGKPLFVVKYHIPEGDYRIIKYRKDGSYYEGKTECVPISETPEDIIRLALRASSAVGDGLYGIDIKQRQEKLYFIEINDNVSIDAGTEDQLEGDSIYIEIMRWFDKRL